MRTKIHYAPRTAAVETDLPDILVPALAALRSCIDSIGTLVLIDSLPDILLPGLASMAARRPNMPDVAVKTLVRYCGPLFLERCLGKQRASELARYTQQASS